MLSRNYKNLIQERLKIYPAVALIGPRQCGKTTLAKQLGTYYFDCEQESERLRLDLEWDNLEKVKSLVILDEAQAWPALFERLRGSIDKQRQQNGRFLLLGSVAPTLMSQISESLAGRLSIIELTPFLLSELESETQKNRQWLVGGYPNGGIIQPKHFPQWQTDYLQLMIQRDLPALGASIRPQIATRFIKMLAAFHGQIWNASQIGQSLDLSYHTINKYCDYLEGMFLIRHLHPYSKNLKKRLVKSPKIYWRDSGLLHAILGIDNHKSLLNQPWVGASWESFAIEQILGQLALTKKKPTPYFFRTSDGIEIDLVLDFGTETWAIEIKLTASPSPNDWKKLEKAANLIDANRLFLISQQKGFTGSSTKAASGLREFLAKITTQNLNNV